MSRVLFLSLFLCEKGELKSVKETLKFKDLSRKGGDKEQEKTIFHGLKHQTIPV